MSASDRLRDALAAAKAQSERDPTYNPAVCIVPDEVMARLDADEVADILAGAVERLAEPAEPDSRERLEARVAELQGRSAVTLTEFLLARIAEDESVARDWSHHGERKVSIHGGGSGYAAVVSPARVLAECEAKRRIVAAQPYRSLDEATADGDSERWFETEWVLRILATVYADHADFRDEWRP